MNGSSCSFPAEACYQLLALPKICNIPLVYPHFAPRFIARSNKPVNKVWINRSLFYYDSERQIFNPTTLLVLHKLSLKDCRPNYFPVNCAISLPEFQFFLCHEYLSCCFSLQREPQPSPMAGQFEIQRSYVNRYSYTNYIRENRRIFVLFRKVARQ